MMDIDTIELHDALLQSMDIDYVAKTVKIRLEYYSNQEEKYRKLIFINFEEVSMISEISNLKQLQKNAFAGNVNYWVPKQDDGVTYIYLTDGCIAIHAHKIYIALQ